MKDGVCYIVGAGDAPQPLPIKKRDGDFIVAADAGYLTLTRSGILPDAFVGDGDSLGFVPDIPDKKILPVVKDDTDTVAAVKLGFDRGYKKFVIYGALGGARFSHSISNLQTLLYIDERGGEGEIAGEGCLVKLLTEKNTPHRPGQKGGYISFFAVAGDASVSVSGAKYEVERETLSPSFPLGVSNEPEEDCEITVRSGKVVAVLEP